MSINHIYTASSKRFVVFATKPNSLSRNLKQLQDVGTC